MKKMAWLLFFCLCACEKKTAPPLPIKVEVITVTQRDVQDYVEAIGNVYEYSIVEVRPQVSGTLLAIHVEEGAYVERGTPLFEIDPKRYIQLLDEAEANFQVDLAVYEIAKSTVNRYAEVAEKDYISALRYEQYLSDLESAAAQLEADKAQIELAKINLGYCSITSPIAGKVSLYNVDPGNLVVVDDPLSLIEIRQLAPADIRFAVPQRDFQTVHKQEEIKDLKFEAYLPFADGKPFQGTLYFIDNHVDLLTGTILLKGYVPNDDLSLWPGEYVRVRLFTQMLKDALVVPISSVLVGQQGNYVYVLKEDMTVEPVNVTTGTRDGQEIVIQHGLKAGDKVVSNGQINLRAGAEVTVVERIPRKNRI